MHRDTHCRGSIACGDSSSKGNHGEEFFFVAQGLSRKVFGYYLSVSLREIHVSGYRSVRDLRLKLRSINVLTGPNASGKSNLYNSVFLLAKAAAGGFAQVIADEGGMPSVLWAGARKSRSLGSVKLEPVRMSLG